MHVLNIMRDLALCTPDIFYTPKMQKFIMNRCNDTDKQWIYSMMQGKPVGDNEQVFEVTDAWVLCKDIHQGSDFRMLVVFKDMDLKTIRDLRAEHVPLLLDIKRSVRRKLQDTLAKDTANEYKIYFHYTPSVYQLHAHVCIPGQYYNHYRTHNINTVISNLNKNTYYYRDAILMFSLNKSIKALNIHSTIVFENSEHQENVEQKQHAGRKEYDEKNQENRGITNKNMIEAIKREKK